METCAAVIPNLLQKYPLCSFAFNGSRTYDRSNYIESPHKTQRYRIYIELVRRLFGKEVFSISTYDASSACLFINRLANPDINAAKTRIYDMFANIYEIFVWLLFLLIKTDHHNPKAPTLRPAIILSLQLRYWSVAYNTASLRLAHTHIPVSYPPLTLQPTE